jgi:DNA-binding GntR family transcriptional regulator
MGSIFSEVQPKPLSDIALEHVREAIVDGRFPPGASINQAELAKQLGISRAPLREALQMLQQEGLVENQPFRGTVVTPLTAESLRELQSLRRLLETFAAEQVLERATDADLAILEGIVAEMAGSVTAGDLDAVNDADIRLHSKIIELSGHSLLVKVWGTYVQQIRRALSLRNRANVDLTPLAQMHREFVDALVRRDVDAVRRFYAVHGSDLATTIGNMLNPADAPANGVSDVLLRT